MARSSDPRCDAHTAALHCAQRTIGDSFAMVRFLRLLREHCNDGRPLHACADAVRFLPPPEGPVVDAGNSASPIGDRPLQSNPRSSRCVCDHAPEPIDSHSPRPHDSTTATAIRMGQMQHSSSTAQRMNASLSCGSSADHNGVRAMWCGAETQTRPLLPAAAAPPATATAAIDAAFHDDAGLVRRAQERQRAGREKGWNRTTTTDTPSAMNASAAATTAASSTSAVAASVPRSSPGSAVNATSSSVAPRSSPGSAASASASSSPVVHPHKFSTSSRGAGPPPTPQRPAGAVAAAPAASSSPHVPSALDERHALRQERDDVAHRYVHRLDQFYALQARKRIRRVWRSWRTLACTPRDLAVRARAFAQFQLLIRTLATWRTNGKLHRETQAARLAEEAQAKEVRLQQRALKFYRMKRLRVLFRSWLLASQALAASHAASDARSERAEKMAKLLAALEKKKAGGGEITAAGPVRPASAAQQMQQESAHSPTLSSQARHSATAAAPSAHQAQGGSVDSPQKRKPLQRPGSALPAGSPLRATTGGSSNSSSRAASARSEFETAAAGGHSSEYKERLMAERAKRTASAGAASAAAAIAAGSSVYARPDLADSLLHSAHAPTSSSASARAFAAASLLAPVAVTTGGAFAVASASSMSERAELRALRRAEIQAHQAAQEAARKAEAEAKLAEEAAAIDAAKRALLQSKREARRAEAQALEDKARAKEMEAAAHALALMHHARSQLVFFGWVPWRRLVERQRIRCRAMDQRAAAHTVRRLFARWGQAVVARRARRAELEQRKEEKASRHFVRRRLRSVLRQWKRVLGYRAQQMERKRAWHSKQMLRRCFRALRRICSQLAQSRAQRERKLEPRIVSLGCTTLSRHFWLRWLTAVEHGRAERTAARKQSDLKSKVGGWLEEFRAQKARERGDSTELPSAAAAAVTAGTAAQAFARLKLDVPQSTAPAPVMLSPARSVAPSGSSFAPTAVLSPRSSSIPLSPSSLLSYSALRHPSAQSPRLASSPLSAAAAIASPRVASHAEMMAVLSPRAAAVLTAARRAPQPAFSFDAPAASPLSPSRAAAAASEFTALSSPTYHGILSSPRASAGAAVVAPSLDPLDSEEEAKSNEERPKQPRPASAASSTAAAAVAPSKAAAISIKPKPTANAVGSTSSTAVRARPALAARGTAYVPPPSAVAAAAAAASAATPKPAPSPSKASALTGTTKSRPLSATASGAAATAAPAAPSGTLSGSNVPASLSSTAVPNILRKVSFGSTGSLELKPSGSPQQQHPVARAPTAAASPPPSAGLSLIAAAKAKALELDLLDSNDAASTMRPAVAATTANSNLFTRALQYDSLSRNLGARPSAAAAAAAGPYDDPSEESLDEFDRHMESLLTRSAPPVTAKGSAAAAASGGRAGPAAALGRSPYASGASAVAAEAMDSSRSNSSDISTTSLSSATSYRPTAGPTWSAQHARPSVGLAAARAQRKEEQTKMQQLQAQSNAR